MKSNPFLLFIYFVSYLIDFIKEVNTVGQRSYVYNNKLNYFDIMDDGNFSYQNHLSKKGIAYLDY